MYPSITLQHCTGLHAACAGQRHYCQLLASVLVKQMQGIFKVQVKARSLRTLCPLVQILHDLKSR
jgi:hypothetical protein